MRKTVMIAVTGLAALSLAGCGGGGETAANQSVVPIDNVVASTPAPPEAAPSPGATSTPDASPGVAEAGQDEARIPRALRGRWGLVPADCTSTRGDNKGLLVVSDETLRFYESVGTLDTVVERDDGRLVGDFGFTGEGMTWKRRMTLDAQDGGQTLIRREDGEGAMPGPLRYRRCA